MRLFMTPVLMIGLALFSYACGQETDSDVGPHLESGFGPRPYVGGGRIAYTANSSTVGLVRNELNEVGCQWRHGYMTTVTNVPLRGILELSAVREIDGTTWVDAWFSAAHPEPQPVSRTYKIPDFDLPFNVGFGLSDERACSGMAASLDDSLGPPTCVLELSEFDESYVEGRLLCESLGEESRPPGLPLQNGLGTVDIEAEFGCTLQEAPALQESNTDS